MVIRDISVKVDPLEAAPELFCLDTLKEKSLPCHLERCEELGVNCLALKLDPSFGLILSFYKILISKYFLESALHSIKGHKLLIICPQLAYLGDEVNKTRDTFPVFCEPPPLGELVSIKNKVKGQNQEEKIF